MTHNTWWQSKATFATSVAPDALWYDMGLHTTYTYTRISKVGSLYCNATSFACSLQSQHKSQLLVRGWKRRKGQTQKIPLPFGLWWGNFSTIHRFECPDLTTKKLFWWHLTKTQWWLYLVQLRDLINKHLFGL